MTGLLDRTPVAQGALRDTPFCHLLIYIYRKASSGTLVLLAEATGEASIRLQRGRPNRALLASSTHDLLEAMLPLCALSQGSFSFFEEDLLSGVSDAIAGDVDPYALLGASLREHTRDDVVDDLLLRYRGCKLRLPPKREVDRLHLDRFDLALVDLIRAAPATPEELLAQAPLPVLRARRLLYALIATQIVVPHDEHTQQTVQTARSLNSTELPTRSLRPRSRSSPAWQLLASLRPDVSIRLDVTDASLRPTASPSAKPNQAAGSARPDSAPQVSFSLRPSGLTPIATPASMIPEDDVPARIKRAEHLMQRGRHDDALAEVDALLRLEPERAELHGLRAHVLFDKHSKEEQGLPRSVIDALKRALEIDADETRALYTRGLVCKRAGDPKKAGAYFKRVLQIDPKHVDAQREIRLAKLRGG
jgi:tetratricopeptide (TPR) repeat protein